MTERLGDAPIQECYREKMQEVAKALDGWFNGFAQGSNQETRSLNVRESERPDHAD